MPNDALLAKVVQFKKTGMVPEIRMGADPSIPDTDVFWAHRDTRGLGDFLEIALDKKNQNYDPSTPDGLANFRAFHVAICQTIVRMGGFKIPPTKEGDPATPAFVEVVSTDPATGIETKTQIAEMSPLTSALSGLQVDQQLQYEKARAVLINTLVQYGKRFALLSGDRHWDDPPIRSKLYNPIFTENGDPAPKKGFALPTPPPPPAPGADPDKVPPVLIGQVAEVGTTVMVVGIVGLLLVGCYVAYKVSENATTSKGVDALSKANDAAHNRMTETTQEALAIADAHIAEDRKNGKVTPLTPAEQAKIDILLDAQRKYYDETKSLEAQIFGLTKPAPSAANTLAEQVGGVLKTAAWLGAALLVGKFVYTSVFARKREEHPPTSEHEPSNEPRRPFHGGGATG